MAAYHPILERNNETYVKELSAMGSELTLEDVSGHLVEAEKTLETIKTRIPATVRIHALSAIVPMWCRSWDVTSAYQGKRVPLLGPFLAA